MYKSYVKIFLLFLGITAITFSQTDAPTTPEVFTNTPHPTENNLNKTVVPEQVQQWEAEFYNARRSGDFQKAKELLRKIDESYGIYETDYRNTPVDRPVEGENIPGEVGTGDWYDTDVTVFTGGIRSDGYRQLALINGDDGNLYTVINTTATNSTTRLYRSTNKGVTWSNIGTVTFGSNYAQSVNIAYADSGASVNRITLLIAYGSQAPPTRNASIWYVSWRTTGSMLETALVQAPPGGQGFRNPTICTDGLYYSPSSTYFYGTYEAVDASGNVVGIYACRSVSFGNTWTTYASVATGFNDQFPYIDFKHTSGTDSIYIATTRQFSASQKNLRLHKQSIGNMGTAWGTIYLVNDVARYERFALSIRHTNLTSANNQMLLTYSKNDSGRYSYSNDAGVNWTLNNSLAFGNENPVSYTACFLDSQSAGNNYAKTVFISNGDSVIYRGGVLGSLGVRIKVNQNVNSGLVVPGVSSTREGNTTCGAVIYAGSGPTNAYFDGECLITGIQPVGNETPSSYKLEQNYPNPFNPVTNIKFSIPNAGNVKLVVYDMLGKEVATLVNQDMSIGTYNVDFDAAALSSGVYFYKLTTGDFTSIKKMMLVK